MGNLIVGGIIFAILGGAIYRLFIKKKSGCGCHGCDGCSKAENCK